MCGYASGEAPGGLSHSLCLPMEDLTPSQGTFQGLGMDLTMGCCCPLCRTSSVY